MKKIILMSALFLSSNVFANLNNGFEFRMFLSSIQGEHSSEDLNNKCTFLNESKKLFDDYYSNNFGFLNFGGIFGTIGVYSQEERILSWVNPGHFENKGSFDSIDLREVQVTENRLKFKLAYLKLIRVENYAIWDIEKDGNALKKITMKLYEKKLFRNKLVKKLTCNY